jgi:hypothetical protein
LDTNVYIVSYPERFLVCENNIYPSDTVQNDSCLIDPPHDSSRTNSDLRSKLYSKHELFGLDTITSLCNNNIVKKCSTEVTV